MEYYYVGIMTTRYVRDFLIFKECDVDRKKYDGKCRVSKNIKLGLGDLVLYVPFNKNYNQLLDTGTVVNIGVELNDMRKQPFHEVIAKLDIDNYIKRLNAEKYRKEIICEMEKIENEIMEEVKKELMANQSKDFFINKSYLYKKLYDDLKELDSI